MSSQNSSFRGSNKDQSFGQRMKINIDENEETFHGQDSLSQILERGKRLQTKMDIALDDNELDQDAFKEIHGVHIVPKKYVPPFQKDTESGIGKGTGYLKNDGHTVERRDPMDALYEVDMTQSMRSSQADFDQYTNQVPQKDLNHKQGGASGQNQKNSRKQAQSQHQQHQAQPESYNIQDMKYICLRVKHLKITNDNLQQKLIDQGLSLSISLPLADIYTSKITNQVIKLTNYDFVSSEKFEFHSMSLFHFHINQKTFNNLQNSDITVELDGNLKVKGSLKFNNLILADKFKLETAIPMEQTVLAQDHQASNQRGKKKLKSAHQKVNMEEQYVQVPVGSCAISLNLQRGDSEEEKKKNYSIELQKLKDEKKEQEEQHKKEMERKLSFNMAKEPTIAQMYVHIDRMVKAEIIKKNPMLSDANMDPSNTLNEREGQQQQEQQNAEGQQTNNDLERQDNYLLPKRNLFVTFKAFPSLEKLQTNVAWQQQEPDFHYRAQLPVLMTPELLSKLEKFTLVFEVWDQETPSQSTFLGLAKVPLASFCYSMKTTNEGIYSLNFMADQHCLYPMIVTDDYLPVYSPKLGKSIGQLKITVAMGSLLQVNRQIQKEQDLYNKRILQEQQEKIIEMQRQQNKMSETLILSGNKEKETQALQMKMQLEKEERERKENEQFKVEPQKSYGSPIRTGLTANNMSMMIKRSLNQEIQQVLGLGSSGLDYDFRKQTLLQSMRKFFEEARNASLDEVNGEYLFPDSQKHFDGTVKKEQFVDNILSCELFTLTRSECNQILTLVMNINRDDKGNVDIDELQFSYKSYLKYYELMEARILDLLEKFKLSITKKIEDLDELDDLAQLILDKSTESKLVLSEFKQTLEHRGVDNIMDSLYDQLMQFFDLDRSGQLYVTTFCQYLKTHPNMQSLSFFKVSPLVLTQQMNDYIRSSCQSSDRCLEILEDEFKKEIFAQQKQMKKSKLKQKLEDSKENTQQQSNKDGEVVQQQQQDTELQELESEVAELDQQVNAPFNYLVNERVNAKLFQFKMKKQGIPLSLWETLTFFEHVNINISKMHYEPERFHFIRFADFYYHICGEKYVRMTPEEEETYKAEELKKELDLVQELNKKHNIPSPTNKKKRKRFGSEDSSEGLYTSSQMESSSEQDIPVKKDPRAKNIDQKQVDSDNEERPMKKRSKNDNYEHVKHIFKIKVKELKNIPILQKLIQDTFQYNQAQTMREGQIGSAKTVKQMSQKISKYIQNIGVKYSFPLDEDEILESDYIQLDQTSLESQGQYNYVVSMNTVHSYLMHRSDPIENLLQSVSTSTQYQGSQPDDLFNISLALYQDSRQFVIGNAQLPIEDIIQIIKEFQEQKGGSYMKKHDVSVLERVLFVYGTTYSQRENCIIGKLNIEIEYTQERQFLTKHELKMLNQRNKDGQGNINQNQCFMHRETYINRKIPLNARLSVYIDRVANLKESIENIEHFSRIQQSSELSDQPTFNSRNEDDKSVSKYTGSVANSQYKKAVRDRMEQADRRKILTNILKNGMNLEVISSVFEEDESLKNKFDQLGAKHETRILYNTLNPIFGQGFDLNLQMDSHIFDYLKNKRASFEIRHYIIQSSKHRENQSQLTMLLDQNNTNNPSSSFLSQRQNLDDEPVDERQEYIVIGYARVPLLQLITRNNGIDGEFQILDEYKQQMGTIKLKICLNHHNNQRPLYSVSNNPPTQVSSNPQVIDLETQLNQPSTLIDKSVAINVAKNRGDEFNPKEHVYLLGLNFIELIVKSRKDIFEQTKINLATKPGFLYLKFRMLNQNYQTKLMAKHSLGDNPYFALLDLQVINLNKTFFIELDFKNQTMMENALGKPLEIQLWHKIESNQHYEKAEHESLLGSFFIELNEVTKEQGRNRRVKEQGGFSRARMLVHEAYYTLHDYRKQEIAYDRLALKTYLFRKDYDLLQNDLEEILNVHKPVIENHIYQQVDTQAKGYVDLEELLEAVKSNVRDGYMSSRIKELCNQCLEFKKIDKVFYSPLFGLPPPFFKYAKRFDSFGVVEKFHRELTALDCYQSGFVPLALFRSVLEHELKIKAKIVDDFIMNIKDRLEANNQFNENKSLDLNIVTHSFQTHIDYVVLLRKLCMYQEIQNMNEGEVYKTLSTVRQPGVQAQVATLTIDIESAMRLRNPLNELEPPNTYVVLKPQYQSAQGDYDMANVSQPIQTQTINRNCYPQWQHINSKVIVPLTDYNLQHMSSRQLEFQVYHSELAEPSGENKFGDKNNHLIGVAYVDLSPFVYVGNSSSITGYFHIVNSGDIRSSKQMTYIDPMQMTKQSLGQLKVSVKCDVDLKSYINKFMPNATELKDMSSNQVLQKEDKQLAESFGTPVYNPVVTMDQRKVENYQQSLFERQDFNLNSQTSQKVETQFNKFQDELQAKDEEDVKAQHDLNMKQLDELHAKLKQTLSIQTSAAQVQPNLTQEQSQTVAKSPKDLSSTFKKAGDQSATLATHLNDFRSKHLNSNYLQQLDTQSLTTSHQNNPFLSQVGHPLRNIEEQLMEESTDQIKSTMLLNPSALQDVSENDQKVSQRSQNILDHQVSNSSLGKEDQDLQREAINLLQQQQDGLSNQPQIDTTEVDKVEETADSPTFSKVNRQFTLQKDSDEHHNEEENVFRQSNSQQQFTMENSLKEGFNVFAESENQQKKDQNDDLTQSKKIEIEEPSSSNLSKINKQISLDDDDQFDHKELERVQKILRSTNKD